MENRETVQQAAARESLEEAQAHVQIGSLLAVVHVLEAQQVHMFFRAILPKAEFGISPESLEVGLYAESCHPVGRYCLSQHRIRPAKLLFGPRRRP